MRKYHAICIDDDEEFLQSLEGALPDKVCQLCKQFQIRFDFVASPDELWQVFEEGAKDGLTPGLVVSDQVMPGVTGIDLVEKVKTTWPDTVCVLLTGHAGLDSAKYAINHNLLDQYVAKPIQDMHEFAALLANLLKGRHLDLEEKERARQLAEANERLRQSNERIRAMHAAAEQVALLSKNLKALDFNEVVALATREVPRLFDAHWSVLCFPSDPCPATRLARQDCPCPESDLAGRKDVARAIKMEEPHSGPVEHCCQELGARSPDLVIPLSVGNVEEDAPETLRGFLCMCHVGRQVPESIDLFRYKGQLLGDILSANLTNAKLYQKARRDSRTDALTGVSSRRVLEEALEIEFQRAARYKHTFCVAIADIDCFKLINDAVGHPLGDQTLIQVAKILTAQKRASDILARYGGDEFVLIMPETSLADAEGALERIRQDVEAKVRVQDRPVTVSCGLAGLASDTHKTGADLLRNADAALYEAKRTGRNRVIVGKAA